MDGRRRVAAMVLGSLLAVGLVLAGDQVAVDAERYSAYADPEKPVISFLLSDPENVEDFQREFALDDDEMEDVLAAVRRENEALAGSLSESEEIIRSNRGLPDGRIAEKIEASSYDEKVRAAVARSKGEVKGIVTPDLRPDIGAWVDARWQAEREEFNEDPDVYRSASKAGRGKSFRVFATQYRGHTRREVALPHRKLKFRGGYEVGIRPEGSRKRTRAKVKEIGPWNTYDNWWARQENRDMWRKLRRGKPQAQAAYFNNFNRGRDEFGRKVLNPGGVDLTPRVARAVGLRRYENAWVYVRMPWVRR
ncbi:MAG: hypothetical protein ACR2JR_03225 [Rubrobacteraceae bacterium]